ncbi:hypothetical protein [Streptomyces nigrescens]|uniref:Uncharacterized protein n=1 Tax=Streptomyces nigrescens TaxID=1920 RepID=A0ABY7J0N6_STRNI|nr:hypothetical protein [Streptomyces nigrescens]WAU03709.1 hypothetical protein STRNI_001873 [Streptomyces nigrescens]
MSPSGQVWRPVTAAFPASSCEAARPSGAPGRLALAYAPLLEELGLTDVSVVVNSIVRPGTHAKKHATSTIGP